jgi:predicted nucleotidyltransferase
MVDERIKKIIREFVDALTEKGLIIEKTIIYGSCASGSMGANSDLDVAIVSPDLGENRFEEGKMLLQTAWRIDPRLHPVPVSSDAFQNDTWVPLIHEIREHGIEV